jgi:hypothetical protein
MACATLARRFFARHAVVRSTVVNTIPSQVLSVRPYHGAGRILCFSSNEWKIEHTTGKSDTQVDLSNMDYMEIEKAIGEVYWLCQFIAVCCDSLFRCKTNSKTYVIKATIRMHYPLHLK